MQLKMNIVKMNVYIIILATRKSSQGYIIATRAGSQGYILTTRAGARITS